MSRLVKMQQWKQYALSVAITFAVTLACYFISDYVGYRSIALILLFTVSLLATLLSVYPVLVSAVLSALIWDFFFIPPYYTFHVNNTEDVLMLSMYFVIALLNGILTSQIRHFEKLSRIKEEKLNALKFYNTLFNSISHELRTPITTIMGVTENLMSEETKLSEDNKRELNKEVFIASERLNRLVDNLLNMSRIESGFLKPRMDWCDVNELIHSAIRRLPDSFNKQNLQKDIPDDMPLVKLDFGLIEQALYNVIHNAFVHAPAGTIVRVSAIMRDNTIEFSVSDNGPGFIMDETLNEPVNLGQAGKSGGLGLGLSIAKGFINMHQGEIIVANQATGGASVKMIIPVETMEWRENYE